MTRRRLDRRTFLRGTGVALALPLLDAMTPALSAAKEQAKRRMVSINIGLGLHVPHLIPRKAGRDYEITPYLEPLREYRNDLTVISGTSHPGVDGGHLAENSFLTAAPHPGSAAFKNTVSIDQLAAEKIGLATRFAYLPLSLAGRGLSYSRSGVAIPSQTRPSQLFALLFLEGKQAEKQQQLQRLKDNRSVMDVVLDKANRMRGRLGASDRAKLDEYFAAVRETELRLVKAQEWEKKPKPKVDVAPPRDISDRTDIIGRARLMYDLIHLALQTDSSRLVTFHKNGINAVPQISGVTQDYHNLSHHGRDPAKIKELQVIETEQIKIFAEFLGKLRRTREGNTSLLDQTMVLLGSNLGNASSHNNRNLPIVFAGGGFKHGSHLAFDPNNNYPLPNLFVTMLQRLGLKVDRFATSTGTMAGLET